MNRRILLVDDEPEILDSFKRQLRKKFVIDTATGGLDGLRRVITSEPYAVIVSDYHMPGIDGIQFLASAKQKSPDTVRIMLTGKADLQTAMDAVNEGQIFRFLTKPCPEEMLIKTLQSGLEQFRLVTAEKELLEKTLSGSIKVLTEILSLVNPSAFGRAMRIKSLVNHMTSRLKIPEAWQYEIAALLSLIGCVTIPPEVMDKINAGSVLTPVEKDMADKHPAVARELLVNIPRLGSVARMIEAQGDPFSRRTRNEDFQGEDMISLGGNLLSIAMNFDRLISGGKAKEEALQELSMNPEQYYDEAVETLREYEVSPVDKVMKSIHARELNTNMILNEDIKTRNGMLVAVKGQEVSNTMLRRLRAFVKSIGINEPFSIIEKK